MFLIPILLVFHPKHRYFFLKCFKKGGNPLLLHTSSVPDPKLIISDPDPDHQIENQEFQIRILL